MAVTLNVNGSAMSKCVYDVCLTGSTDDKHRFVTAATEVEGQSDGNSSDHDKPRSAGLRS